MNTNEEIITVSWKQLAIGGWIMFLLASFSFVLSCSNSSLYKSNVNRCKVQLGICERQELPR